MRINLASKRLAVILIAALLLLITLSALIPQRNLAEGRMIDWQEVLGDNYRYIGKLGLDRIYYSPIFFVVLGLLAVNLIFGNIRRFRTVYRTERTLLKLRYIGSILFHLSLILIMATVILNYLYKYEGTFALTEGQQAVDAPDAYFREFRGPLTEYGYGHFDLKVSEISASNDAFDEKPTTVTVEISPAGGLPRTALLRTNNPLAISNLELHYGLVTGYSPEVVLQDSTGATILRGFVRLAVQRQEKAPLHRDFVVLPAHGLRVDLEVASGAPDQMPSSVQVAVHTGGEAAEATLFAGALPVGDSASFDGYNLKIPRLRQWAYIVVVDSPFLNWVFVGFWLALSGLALVFAAGLRYGREDHDRT